MMQGFRKFKAVPTEYNGIVYRSKQEVATVKKLEARKASGEIRDWERERILEFRLNGTLIARYRIDFVPIHADGTIELLETKGMMLSDWKIKWRLLEAFVGDPKWRECNGFSRYDRIILRVDAGPKVLRWVKGERKAPKKRKKAKV